jgi:Rrf2 family cysteine metabolism transcriptional repressor
LFVLRISTKTRYAVRIMIYLGRYANSDPARKQDIAESEVISADYVEQILIRLRGAELVKSHRGARGGFTIARDAHHIRLLDVIEAVDGPLGFIPEEDIQSDHPTIVATSKLWTDVQSMVSNALAERTIADLAEEVGNIELGSQLMYDI